MKKVLYLMNIDWFWIKQRPQFIAELLSKDYNVTVLYYREIFRKISLRNGTDELENSIAIPAIPFRDKSRIAHLIQLLLFKRAIRTIEEYDIVWIGYPLLYRYIPKDYRGTIVYDCMDNHEALCSDSRLKPIIKSTERELICRAEIIFVTSDGLMKKVQNISGQKRPILVRNGFAAEKIHRPHRFLQTGNFKIAYYGTISEWMDFSLIVDSLNEFPNLEYDLWGPVSNIQVPEHPRLNKKGVAEHDRLWEHVKDSQCLIMPFQVNDIIRDVDPVKLYEYISMGKPVITVYYEELERFRPFVFFYNSYKQYRDILQNLMSDSNLIYTMEDQEQFLEDNTWEQRYRDIHTALEHVERRTDNFGNRKL